MGTIYKYRELTERSISIVEKPVLYFASPRMLDDPLETSALIEFEAHTIGAIAQHLREYKCVLLERRKLEAERANVQFLKYTHSEDMEAYYRWNMREARVQYFDSAIKYADELIAKVLMSDDCGASNMLVKFYESIVTPMRDAGVCSFSLSPTINPMWSAYASEHRGICLEFSDDLFSRHKKIVRRAVSYSVDGKIDPLQIGYLETYDLLFSMKNMDWKHQQEIRFFIFGDPRPVRVPAAKLKSVILGTRTLTGDGLSGGKLATHKSLLKRLAAAILSANKHRAYWHRTRLKIASRQPGHQLRIDPVEDENALLKEVAAADEV